MSAAQTMRFPLLIALTAAFCTSCFMDGDPEIKDIVPLQVGNTWTYVDTVFYGPDSLETDSSQVTVSEAKVVHFENEDHLVYLKHQKNPATGVSSALKEYDKVDQHSLYTYGAEQDTVQVLDKSLHVQYPTQKGNRYQTHFLGFAPMDGTLKPVIDTVDITVLNTDTLWSGPAGTFSHCIHYMGKRVRGNWSAHAFYAPGIGYLGAETSDSNLVDGKWQTVLSKSALKSYSLY